MDYFKIDFSKPKAAYEYKTDKNGNVEIKVGDTTLYGKKDSGIVQSRPETLIADGTTNFYFSRHGAKILGKELIGKNIGALGFLDCKNIRVDGGKSVDKYYIGNCENISIKDNKYRFYNDNISGNEYGVYEDTNNIKNLKVILNNEDVSQDILEWAEPYEN